jgi:centrosomal protein CEP76
MDLQTLRGVIAEQLQSDEVFEQISKALQVVPGGGAAAEEGALAALQQQGVIDDVIRAIDERRPGASSAAAGEHARTFLRMKVEHGSAFASSDARDPDDAEPSPSSSFLQLHVAFRNQRFRSEAVACSMEPAFDESFLLELQSPAAGPSAMRVDLRSLLHGAPSPVHMVLLRLTPEPGSLNLDTARRQLVAVHGVDWRRSLGRGGVSLPVELMAAGAQASKVPVGILNCRFDLLPAPRHGHAVPAAEITKALQLADREEVELHRQFYQYARAWWTQFSGAGPAHKERPVKIFALSEHGEHRSVCSFVCPLRPGRCLLDTPRHAARFVSLLPFERAAAVGGGRLEVWHSAHTLLARGRGDVEEHAVLLASLLLGFGLDAYVVMGTADDGVHDAPVAHTWVMTRADAEGAGEGGGHGEAVTFWESLKGERWAQRQPAEAGGATHAYRTVGCVFSHNRFYGNVQAIEDAGACSFDLEDASAWKAMDGALLARLPHQPPVAVMPTEIEPRMREESIEKELRLGIERLRHSQQLPLPVWDEELCYVLSPALAAYETERTLGISAGNTEFQSAIKRAVPGGQCFQGFPTAFAHMSVARMLASFDRGEVPHSILHTQGSGVRFALRVKLVPYPENVVVVWVMLAVRFIAPS